MCLAEVPVEHGLHHVTPGYQHCSMSFHVTIVQFERDITEDAILNTIFLQILFHALQENMTIRSIGFMIIKKLTVE